MSTWAQAARLVPPALRTRQSASTSAGVRLDVRPTRVGIAQRQGYARMTKRPRVTGTKVKSTPPETGFLGALLLIVATAVSQCPTTDSGDRGQPVHRILNRGRVAAETDEGDFPSRYPYDDATGPMKWPAAPP